MKIRQIGSYLLAVVAGALVTGLALVVAFVRAIGFTFIKLLMLAVCLTAGIASAGEPAHVRIAWAWAQAAARPQALRCRCQEGDYCYCGLICVCEREKTARPVAESLPRTTPIAARILPARPTYRPLGHAGCATGR
jgi:hypothetical protein